MIGKISVIQDDRKAIFITVDQPIDFKMNQLVDIEPHKNKRSLSQNRFYWAYLTWLISKSGEGLIDQGHWSTDGLHSDIKAWIKDKYPNQFDMHKMFTTTALNTKEFNDYIDIIDRELMVGFFGIDTSKFWGNANSSSNDKMPF
jgi:hypothetical protein